MKKFKCVVTREEEYIIELDENILDEEWMEHFKKHFYKFNALEEHAEHLAITRARLQSDYIEGYGHVLINGIKPWNLKDDDKDLEPVINIKIVSEDDDIYVEVEEVE